MAQLWDWTPRPTRTRLLHDVAAKPAVLSTPGNDQVLIDTLELREASVGEFLAQGNCDSVTSTRIEPSTLITEYKIPDVITNALPSASPLYHLLHRPTTHTPGTWNSAIPSMGLSIAEVFAKRSSHWLVTGQYSMTPGLIEW